MTEIWFIRHGESESNAGLPSSSDLSTPLTSKGVDQAHHVADYLKNPPDLFILSPYLRTQQTAAPALLKFPDTPIQIWPVQEYSYLSHHQYRNTTSKDRRGLSRSYFEEADPDKVLGEGGESFHQFIGRVNVVISSLQAAEEKKIIIFGHGWFLRAMLWQLYQAQPNEKFRIDFIKKMNSILPSSKFTLWLFRLLETKKWFKKMFSFLIFSAGIQTPNCAIYKFSVMGNSQLTLTGFDISHLPEHLIGTTLVNR